MLGKGDLAVRIAAWLRDSPAHDLVAVVPVVPEPAWTESITDWARDAGVPVVESGHFRDLPLDGEGRAAELGVSVFYDRIVDAAGIAAFGRLLNIHNGPLPRYRGVSPINWALKNGETEHGVTIHEITPGIDDGPIVAQLRYSIYPDTDEVEDVYRRALAYGWTLFEQTMPVLDSIEARPQDDAAATYYSREDDDRLGDRAGFRREGAPR